jgi:hypothetical protein
MTRAFVADASLAVAWVHPAQSPDFNDSYGYSSRSPARSRMSGVVAGIETFAEQGGERLERCRVRSVGEVTLTTGRLLTLDPRRSSVAVDCVADGHLIGSATGNDQLPFRISSRGRYRRTM